MSRECCRCVDHMLDVINEKLEKAQAEKDAIATYNLTGMKEILEVVKSNCENYENVDS